MKLTKLANCLLFCTIIFLSGCGKDHSQVKKNIGQERKVEVSQSSIPAWVTKRPKADKNFLYFVGDDTSGSISGIRDAYQVALSKISFFINTQVNAGYKQIENELGRDGSDSLKQEMIQNISKSSIQGAEEKEIYWEKIEKVTPTGLSYFYQVYSLVQVPVSVIEDSAKATLKAQQNAAKDANDEAKYERLKNVESDFSKLF